MDTRPQPLPYARPDVNRRPADDREVRIGSGLQLLLFCTCLSTQVATWLSGNATAGGNSQPDLRFGVLCLGTPALSAIALAGSSGRYQSQRRALYGVYLAGLLAVTLVSAIVFSFFPKPGDDRGAWWYVTAAEVICNPAAIWIVGRWALFLAFPALRHRRAPRSRF